MSNLAFNNIKESNLYIQRNLSEDFENIHSMTSKLCNLYLQQRMFDVWVRVLLTRLVKNFILDLALLR